MPVLDAKALKTDRKGLAFLRAVLSDGRADEAEGRKTGSPRAPKRHAASAQDNLNR